MSLILRFADRFLQPEQSLVAGLEAVADPHPPHPRELTWSPLSISSSATRWAPRVGQDRLLDRGRDAVRCGPFAPGNRSNSPSAPWT